MMSIGPDALMLDALSLVGACFLALRWSHGKVRMFHAMFVASSKRIWLHGLLAELGFLQTKSSSLYADNTGAINIDANPIFHERTKHNEVDSYSICDAHDERLISLPRVKFSCKLEIFLPRLFQVHVINFLLANWWLLTSHNNLRGGGGSE